MRELSATCRAVGAGVASPLSGRQPPPSALYRRTWSAPRSTLALATLSCVVSCVRWVSSTVWKSTRPLRVALAREQRRVAGRLGGELQVRQALAVAAQRDQRVLDVLQRRQHGRLVGELRLVERGLLRAHLGEQGAAVEQGHRHAGEQRARRPTSRS